MALLAEYQARLIPVIQKHGGSRRRHDRHVRVAQPSPAYAADATAALRDKLA